MWVKKGFIYRASEPYDREKPEYDCYKICITGNFHIVDCFPCKENGEIHSGYNISGVPVNVENLEELIGEAE